MKPSTSHFLLIGISLLVLVALFNAFTVLSLDSKMEKKISEIKEAQRPGEIQMTVISAPCDGCTDITPLIDAVKGSKINLTEEKMLDEKSGASLIAKYGITRLPAIVLEGETKKISTSGFEEKEGALVFTDLPAPYYDAGLRKVIGKVSAWRIDAPACEGCPDMQEIIDAFTGRGVFFAANAQIKPESPEGKMMIAEHGIMRLPALILSDDVSAYPEVLALMTQGGFTKSGDLHLYESTLPFYNVSSKKVRGIVDITLLTDESCDTCYDVSLRRQQTEGIGLTLSEGQTYDISSSQGKAIVAKYAITSVPTMILTGDVSLYPGFDELWAEFGTIESDGAYVFRKNDVTGVVYKDLSTGEVIVPDSTQG